MKNKNSKLTMLMAVVVLATFLTFGMTVSLLMDHEQQDNIITIGKVDLTIEETSFVENQTLSAGSKIAKDPVIKNTGKNDEYVFIRLAIPKRDVTLLYENTADGHSEGATIETPTKVSSEIFKTIVDPVAEQETVSVANNTANLKYVISYRKGDSSSNPQKEGWYYLAQDLNNADYDYYYFGYNRKLLAQNGTTVDKTVPLFNYVQLKSFIDGEIAGGTEDVNVGIEAYGIQADQLGITGLPAGTGLMDSSQVTGIFDIVKRKQGIT